MKLRIKFHTQISSVTLSDRHEISTLADLKTHLRNEIPALRKARVSLSLNGQDPLDESQTLSQSGLVNGDTIYLLDELIRSQSSMSVLEQPLTLDEVRDYQVYPIVIDRLLEAIRPDNEFDYMVIVLHALMLESGFQMDADNNYDLKNARKSSTFYVIRYRHKLCEEERLRCSLAIMRTDALITINGIVNSISQACGKLSFNISNYVHTKKEAMALNPVFPYHDLRHLSRVFKDNLANRLLCKLLEESGQRSSATLIALPNEIKLRLAKYLPIKSLLFLQSTCRDMYNTFNDNLLWHDLCQRDFDKTGVKVMAQSIDPHAQEKNWQQVYRLVHAQKHTTLRHQSKSTPIYHQSVFPLLPSNGPPAAYHPFPPAIYRPIPPTIFRICSANSQQAQASLLQQQQQAQHRLHCQPYFGLKWVVIFAAATMIPFPPGFHHVWLG